MTIVILGVSFNLHKVGDLYSAVNPCTMLELFLSPFGTVNPASLPDKVTALML